MFSRQGAAPTLRSPVKSGRAGVNVDCQAACPLNIFGRRYLKSEHSGRSAGPCARLMIAPMLLIPMIRPAVRPVNKITFRPRSWKTGQPRGFGTYNVLHLPGLRAGPLFVSLRAIVRRIFQAQPVGDGEATEPQQVVAPPPFTRLRANTAATSWVADKGAGCYQILTLSEA